MAMIKDLLKTIQGINADTEIKPSEKMVMLCLIQYYNADKGYSYPRYEDIKQAMVTKRDDTVSNALKSLVAKGYITISKSGRKNIYYILKHLFIVEKDIKQEVQKVNNANVNLKSVEDPKPIDSTGQTPMSGQVHVADLGVDVNNDVVNSICQVTGFNSNESVKLLEVSGNNTQVIFDAYEYTNRMTGVVNKFNYVLAMVRKIRTKPQQPIKSYETKTNERNFNNFEPRSYDYDSLEWKLLGWDDDQSNDTCCTYNPIVAGLK